MKQIDEKSIPHNQEAEEGLCGSLLIDGGCFKEINGLVGEEDFFSSQSCAIFKACASLYSREVSIDVITVANELTMLKLEGIINGGVSAYLNHLVAITPTSLDARYYAEIIHRLAIFRNMITLGGKITELGYEVKPDVSPALDKADEMILSLRKKAAYTPIITPRLRAEIMLERYNTMFHEKKDLAVHTGFGSLDKNFGGGFYNGELVIVAGRPGIGKTSVLYTMARAQGEKHPVLFCSAEMPVTSITDREMATRLGVHVHIIRAGKYSHEMLDRITDQIGEMETEKIYFLENKRGQLLTTSRILTAAVEMQLRWGLTAIYVDYLGLMADAYGNNQNERLGFVTRQLKAIAMDLDVPVVVAHQMSRAVAQRENRAPQLSDLYESGHIEANADAVVFIHRENYYDRNSLDKTAQLIVAKERQGGTIGSIPVTYDIEKSQYREIEGRYQDEGIGYDA